MRIIPSGLAAAAALFVLATPALAGTVPGTPGPLVGAGIPALLGLAYVYRRLRNARRG